MRARLVSILLAPCQEMPAASQGCGRLGKCGCLSRPRAPVHLQSNQLESHIAPSRACGVFSRTQSSAWSVRPCYPLESRLPKAHYWKSPWQTWSNQCARFCQPESSRSTSKAALYAGASCTTSGIPYTCTRFDASHDALPPLVTLPASWSAGWGRRGLRMRGVRVGQSAASGAYAGADRMVTAKQPLLPVVIVFDIETSGFSKKSARIIEFAARDADGGEGAQIHSLIYPGAGHSVGHSKSAHHISDAMLPPSLPTWGDFFPKLCAWVDSRSKGQQPILFVAHNGANFDVPFIVWESARAGLEVPPAWRFVDSLKIAQKYVNAKQASLEHLKVLFQVPSEKAAHRAAADVDVTLHVLSRMLQAKQLPLGVLFEFAFAFGIPDKTTDEKRIGLKEEERTVLQCLLADGQRHRQRQQQQQQQQQAATAGVGEWGDGAQPVRGALEAAASSAPRAAGAREGDTQGRVPLEGPLPSASPFDGGRQGVAVGSVYSRLHPKPAPVLGSIARWKHFREKKAVSKAGAGDKPVEDRAAGSGTDHGGVHAAAMGAERGLPPMSLDRPTRAMPWPSQRNGEESGVSVDAAGMASEGLGMEAPLVRPLPPLGLLSGAASGRGDAVGHSGASSRSLGSSTAVGGAPAGSTSSRDVLVRDPVGVVGVADGGPIRVHPSLPFLAGRAKDGGAQREDKGGSQAGPGAGGQSDRSRGGGLASLSDEVRKAANGEAVPSVLARYQQLAKKIAAQNKGQSGAQP